MNESPAALRTEEIELRLARVEPHVHAAPEADVVVGVVGADPLRGNVHHAVEATIDTCSDGDDRRRRPHGARTVLLTRVRRSRPCGTGYGVYRR